MEKNEKVELYEENIMENFFKIYEHNPKGQIHQEQTNTDQGGTNANTKALQTGKGYR